MSKEKNPEGAEAFFQPVSAIEMPRFAGMPSFMRLPHLDLDAPRIDEVEMGLIGVPWDAGTTNRPGPRHGPRQLRDLSTMIRALNPVTGVNPFATVNCADLGDVGPNPIDLADSMERITAFYAFAGGFSQLCGEDELLPGLPKQLRFQLEIFHKRDVFLKVPFIRHCTVPQILDLVPMVELEFGAPGRHLLREGAQVTMTGRDQSKLDAFVEELSEEGFDADNVTTIVGDCADPQVCRDIVAQAVGAFGKLDVLVNNAGAAGSPWRSSPGPKSKPPIISGRWICFSVLFFSPAGLPVPQAPGRVAGELPFMARSGGGGDSPLAGRSPWPVGSSLGFGKPVNKRCVPPK